MTASKMVVPVAMCFLQAALASTHSLSSRVVGGSPADKLQFPYQVSIRDSRNTNNFNHVCAGVLVGYWEVLTTANCVRDVPLLNLYIVTGTTSLSLATPGSVIANVSYVRVHEFFKPNVYYNNIAFIRLSKKLPENRNDIRPAVLLSDLPIDGANCSVSGWGDTNDSFSPTVSTDLRFTYVPYVSNSECRKRNAYVQADGVCSATYGTAAGPCGKMDSGDPLSYAGGLLGLFSWKEGCGWPNMPSVYTSILFHLYWISQMIHEGSTVNPTSIPTTMPPESTTKPTVKPTPRPNGSCFNSVDFFVLLLALLYYVV